MSIPIGDHEHPQAHDHDHIRAFIRRLVNHKLQEESLDRRLTDIRSSAASLEDEISAAKSPADAQFIRDEAQQQFDETLTVEVWIAG